jgi:mono/diheme cytochrome c family protein
MIRSVPVCCFALAVSVAGFARETRAGQSPPKGQPVYERVCRVCHGPEGEGAAGPALVPFERELEDVLVIVRDGTGQMPPISAERVSDEEIAAVVAYLKTIKPKQ